jgi:quercetin dioxygenase-like cupin family protein
MQTELEFQTLMPGVAVASAVGHFARGAHGSFVRLDHGVRLPLHHYSGAVTGVVVEGEVSQRVPGDAGSARPLGAGASFAFGPGAPHETHNEGDGTALVFIFQQTPWDVVLD